VTEALNVIFELATVRLTFVPPYLWAISIVTPRRKILLLEASSMHWIATSWDVTWSIIKLILVIFLSWGMFIWTPRKIYRKMRKATLGSEYGGFTDKHGQYVPPMDRENYLALKKAQKHAEAEAKAAYYREMYW